MPPSTGRSSGIIWMSPPPPISIVVDVDWVGVEDMVELVVLMDEVEVEVSVIVGDVLLADVLDTVVDQVLSLTQFYSVDFSKSRIDVEKCV